MKVVHLLFTAKHISVVIEGDKRTLLPHLAQFFKDMKTNVSFTKTASGYNIKIVSKAQFTKLVSWLKMGKM